MDNFSEIPSDLSKLDQFLSNREAAYNLKSGTEAQIIWDSGSKHQKTEYAIVYLHGFRASHGEGDPVHKNIARAFGYNLYLSRLEEHGVASEYPLLHLTEEKLLRSAQFALEIGRRIGKKIILMGTSTGGSLALYLASHPEYHQYISSLILYSPLISFYGIKEKLLMNSFTRKILSRTLGKTHMIKTNQTTEAENRIWYKNYTLGGALSLGAFVQHYMKKKLFRAVQCPAFIGYYRKNYWNKDTVVSIPAIKKMVTNLGARTELVDLRNFPEANSHVISSSLVSKATSKVFHHTLKFLERIGSHTARKDPF